MKFSRGIFGLAFLNIIIGRADVFVLARLSSSADLGVYTMGVALIMTPLSFLTNVLGQIVFPALSRVQNDMERLNRILLDVTSWLALFGLPAALSLCLCSSSLLKLIYGTRYAAASAPLSIASGTALFIVLNAAITCALFATGRTALHRIAVAASAATILIVIYPACRSLGTLGGQVAALSSIVAGYLFQLTRMRGLTRLNLRRYTRTFLWPALASAGILAIVLGARRFGLTPTPIADVILCVVTCLFAQGLCAVARVRPLQMWEKFRRAPEPVLFP